MPCTTVKGERDIWMNSAGSRQPAIWALDDGAIDQVSGGLGAPASGESSLLYGAALGAIVGGCLGGLGYRPVSRQNSWDSRRQGPWRIAV